LDEFGNRATLLVALPDVVAQVNQLKKQQVAGQASLFDMGGMDPQQGITFTMETIEDLTDEQKLTYEKEFLGIYLTSHPHLDKLELIKKQITHNLNLSKKNQKGHKLNQLSKQLKNSTKK
jgi:DNA polymerase-3 subunit alpha